MEAVYRVGQGLKELILKIIFDLPFPLSLGNGFYPCCPILVVFGLFIFAGVDGIVNGIFS